MESRVLALMHVLVGTVEGALRREECSRMPKGVSSFSYTSADIDFLNELLSNGSSY